MLKSPIVGAGQDMVLLKDDQVHRAKTFVWTCGIQGCEFAANLRLVKGKCSNRLCKFATTQGTCGLKECQFGQGEYVEGKRGRLLVNERMQTPDYPEVYVVGDVGWYLEGKKVLPQIVETAVQTGATAAAQHHRGHPRHPAAVPPLELPRQHGFDRGEVGRGLRRLRRPHDPALGHLRHAAKHAINVLHLFGVAGVNQVWEYLKHEFLDVKDHRSVLGGHFAGKTRGYWVAILRVFLGVMWLIEGITKVVNGWLKPGSIFIIPVDGATAATGEAVVEATAAASEAAGAAGGGAAAAATTAVTQVPLLAHPLGIYTWLVDNLVSKAPFFFQAVIVLAEIAIGLALVGGLFTAVAAVVSIGLSLMFIIGAMAGKEVLWYIAAAIVMIGGAGVPSASTIG